MKVYHCRYGDFSIPEHSDLIFNALRIYGEWAQEELNMLSLFIKPSDTIIDIGAFIGTHTRAFSKMVGDQGSIHAFEANAYSYLKLLENVRIAFHSNIELHQVALGSSRQSKILLQNDVLTNLGASRLAERNYNADGVVVQVETLDDFHFDKIDMIKVDVEGMEYEVLLGGAKNIGQHKPIIFLEVNSLQASSQIISWAHEMGYSAFGYISDAFNPENFNKSTENIFGEAKECGLLLIHVDRLYLYQDKMSTLKLSAIETIDELSMLLLGKPQYINEVLREVDIFKKIDGLKNVIDERDGLIRACHKQLAILNKKLESTQNDKKIAIELADRRFSECELLQAQLVAAETERLNFEEKNSIRHEELKNTVTELDNNNKELTCKINFLEREALSRDELINQITSSRSWRFTASLRVLGLLSRRWLGLAYKFFFLPRAVKIHGVFSESESKRKIAVVLPVYRDVKMTISCIDAALPAIIDIEDAVLVLVNDASPDIGMYEALLKVSIDNPEKVHLLNNERNMGFVISVNRGMQKFPDSDIVLLNSDVIVPGNWLARLRRDAYSRVDAATVTPLSNNTTICTFPHFLQDNVIPFDMSVDAVDKYFSCDELACVEAPTGIGFCMFIKRVALNKVGYFDEERFGRGYGEENDFCQRAIAHGYVNLISPNMYAYHKGGVSFGSEKSGLIDNATRVIDGLYPRYHADVKAFIESDPLKGARISRYARLLSEIRLPKILCVSHGIGGGVDQHIEELESFLLMKAAFLLLTPSSDGIVELKFGVKKTADSIFYNVPEQIPELVKLLRGLGVSLVHYHHFLRLHPDLLKLSHELGVKHIFTAHDYYVLGGNPSLTNEDGHYPGYRDDNLVNPLYPRDEISAQEWREKFKCLMEDATACIFPSQSTMDIFEDSFNLSYPIVVQHIEIGRPHCFKRLNFQKKNRYQICTIGAIGKEKGADFLEEIAIYAYENNLPYEFSILGYSYRPLRHVRVTGKYKPELLLDIINEHGVDIFIFPAKCPETYSYTLSYAISAGVPIVAPNIGAFPERLKFRGSAKIFPYDAYPSEVCDILNSLIDELTAGLDIVSMSDPGRDFSDIFYGEKYLDFCANTHPDSFDAALISKASSLGENKIDKIDFAISFLWKLYMSKSMRWIDAFISYESLRSIKRRLTNRSIS